MTLTATVFGSPTSTIEKLTEAGTAERFARVHGGDVRYDHRRGRWLVWEAHRWAPDADAAVTRLALDFARAWQRESVEIADRDRREATFKAAIRLERRDALASMLALARALKPIADAGTEWDANAWLLGAPNGVVDLRTGMLRDGRRADNITMTTAVTFDPVATCGRWERFLDEVFDGDRKLIDFQQRAVGYSLSGDSSEQCLFLCDGPGANGKGTFTNTLGAALGDYAYTMPFSTVELHQRSAIPNDLAALVGRRFVVSSETNDGTRLNESRIKALTGCDPITARFLHSEFFTFRPVAKFWLAVNHKPIVRDDSYAFWRRLRLIPFTKTFVINPTLADELRAEGPGILAWAVRGCLAWQHERLNPPAVVITATAAYERDSDPLAGFLTEACALDSEGEVGADDLFLHYRAWTDRHGMGERERLTSTMFGRKVSERFAHQHTRSGKVYKGLSRGPCDGISPMGDGSRADSGFFPRNSSTRKNIEMTLNPSQPVTNPSSLKALERSAGQPPAAGANPPADPGTGKESSTEDRWLDL